jgi:ABC-2 type transport system ATP-binding protein
MSIDKMILQNVTKKYGQKTALNNIHLNVSNGEILGYIGPNGAGKSTTLRIIVGLDTDFEGSILFNGNPFSVTSEYLSQIGYMPQATAFAPWRTVKDTLCLFGKLSGMEGTHLDKRIDEVIEFVDLKDALPLRCSALSGGMKQRLSLAQALLHEPTFIVMDEPFNQLDPMGRSQLKKMVRTLKDSGISVLFSSHILSDVEELTDRVAIIHNASILFQGSLDELSKVAVKDIAFMLTLFQAVDTSKLTRLSPDILSAIEIKPCTYKVSLKHGLQTTQVDGIVLNILAALTAQPDIKIKEFKITGQSLDEMFVNMLGDRA